MCAFLLCRGGEAAGKGLFGGHPTPTSSIGWGQRAQVRWGPTRGRRRHSGDALCLSSPQKKKKHREVMPPPPGACPARPLRRQATRSRLENVTGSFCSRRLLQIPIRCRKREAKQNQAAERSPLAHRLLGALRWLGAARGAGGAGSGAGVPQQPQVTPPAPPGAAHLRGPN